MGAGWLAELKNEPHDIYSKNRKGYFDFGIGKRGFVLHLIGDSGSF